MTPRLLLSVSHRLGVTAALVQFSRHAYETPEMTCNVGLAQGQGQSLGNRGWRAKSVVGGGWVGGPRNFAPHPLRADKVRRALLGAPPAFTPSLATETLQRCPSTVRHILNS